MAEVSSALERFCQEQSFFLDHAKELRKGWPRLKWLIFRSYYFKENGDRLKRPIDDYGRFLRNLIPQELQQEFWQDQLAKLREKQPGLSGTESLDVIKNRIYSTLDSYYQAAPTEIRLRMEWLAADKRDHVRDSNALLSRKLMELKRMRAKGIRSKSDIQAAGTAGLQQIPGIAARTATKIIVSVGDRKKASKPEQFTLSF